MGKKLEISELHNMSQITKAHKGVDLYLFALNNPITMAQNSFLDLTWVILFILCYYCPRTNIQCGDRKSS